MSQVYGGFQLADPNLTYAECVRLGLPVAWWWGDPDRRPNHWTTPLGCRSGAGHVLLGRASLDRLDLNAAHDLTFALTAHEVGGSGHASSVTHKNLHVVLARQVTPGLDDDGAACYLVELADRRRLYAQLPIDAAYNVRRVPGSGSASYYYFSDTLNAGALWTWAQAASAVWSAVGVGYLGAFPGLGYAPAGAPENLDYRGRYALEALDDVLTRLGLALCLDTQSDTFSIVRLGQSDATASAALTRNATLRVLDDGTIEPALARYPEKVRVLFKRSRVLHDETGATPYTAVEVADPSGTPAGVLAGTRHIVHDALEAAYDATGSLTNTSALSARAAEVAADFFRKARLDRASRVYALPLPDAGLRPGARASMATHSDRGGGAVTRPAGRGPGRWAGMMPQMDQPAETRLGRALTTITARSGGAPGTGTVTLFRRASGPVLSSLAETVTVYNAGAASIAADEYVLLKREPVSGDYFVEPPGRASGFVINLTRVCPTFSSSLTIDGTPQTVSPSVVTGISVEYTAYRVPSGEVLARWCVTDPTGCCADDAYTACDCPECPDGVPPVWTFTLSGGTTDFAGANGDWTLVRSGDDPCAWTGTLSGWTATLVYDGTEWVLTVTQDSSGGGTPPSVQYDLAAGADCCGPLVMTSDTSTGTGTLPGTPTLTGQGDCGPCEAPGGGTVTTGCCEGYAIPETLYATFGGAAAALGTITLVYDEGLSTPPSLLVWHAAGVTAEGCNAGDVDLACVSDHWEISSSAGVFGTTSESSSSCDPLEVGFEFTYEDPELEACNGATTVTVTETPPP